jgi:hypothetical protein
VSLGVLYNQFEDDILKQNNPSQMDSSSEKKNYNNIWA